MTAHLRINNEPMPAGAWRALAACRGCDPELFHPVKGGDDGVAAEAKKVCAGCCVRDDCLDEALEAYEPRGVWGGMTPKERQRERARRRRAGTL